LQPSIGQDIVEVVCVSAYHLSLDDAGF